MNPLSDSTSHQPIPFTPRPGRSTVGSGTIVNQVALSYNAFNQLIEDAQSHSGAVAGSTPKVSYSYADGTANQTRRLTTTYPSDKLITMSYGTANSANDRLSRLSGLAQTGDPSNRNYYRMTRNLNEEEWHLINRYLKYNGYLEFVPKKRFSGHLSEKANGNGVRLQNSDKITMELPQ